MQPGPSFPSYPPPTPPPSVHNYASSVSSTDTIQQLYDRQVVKGSSKLRCTKGGGGDKGGPSLLNFHETC
jgi:hypothetical protein